MLTAASVMISAFSWPGTSITKQWLTRRAVRSPASRRTTAAISSSVCRLPFISASALPSRTSCDGRGRRGLAERRIDDLDSRDDRCRAFRRHRFDARARPDEDRRDQAVLRRLDRAFERALIARMRDRGRHRRERLQNSMSRLVLRVFTFHGGFLGEVR